MFSSAGATFYDVVCDWRRLELAGLDEATFAEGSQQHDYVKEDFVSAIHSITTHKTTK